MNPAAPLAARAVAGIERTALLPHIHRPARGPLVVTIHSGELLQPDPPAALVVGLLGRGPRRLAGPTWLTPRARYGSVAASLGQHYGGVVLTQLGDGRGATRACTARCQAAVVRTRPECTCRCSGRYHGADSDLTGSLPTAEPIDHPLAEPWPLILWTAADWHQHFGSQPPRPLDRHHHTITKGNLR